MQASTGSNTERGQRKLIKILADYFGVSIEYFLEDKEEVG